MSFSHWIVVLAVFSPCLFLFTSCIIYGAYFIRNNWISYICVFICAINLALAIGCGIFLLFAILEDKGNIAFIYFLIYIIFVVLFVYASYRFALYVKKRQLESNIICNFCGAKNIKEANFCNTCGKEINKNDSGMISQDSTHKIQPKILNYRILFDCLIALHAVLILALALLKGYEIMLYNSISSWLMFFISIVYLFMFYQYFKNKKPYSYYALLILFSLLCIFCLFSLLIPLVLMYFFILWYLDSSLKFIKKR